MVETKRVVILVVPCCAVCVGLPPPPPVGQGEDASSSSTTGGFQTSGIGTGMTVAVDGAATSSGDTTDPECTGAGGDECADTTRPVCDMTMGTCVPCDAVSMPDVACADVDLEHPLCVDGRCVQCTAEDATICTTQNLLCDAESHTCVACTEHGQCASGACALAEGTCFPAADAVVVHVDGDMDAPPEYFASVGAAVSAAAAGGVGVIVVHALDGDAPYQGAPLINGGKTIALLAAAGEQPILQGTGGVPGLRVEGAGTVVYMEGLALAGNTSGLGLQVTGAVAWVDRSRIVQNSGGGIVVEESVEEIGAVLTLRSSFVGGNEEANVLEVQGSTANILYTTLGAGLGVTTSIVCDAPSMVTVRNSLILSRSDDDAVVCENLDATYTATEVLLDGAGNKALGTMNVAWFMGFNAGDFHLVGGHPMVIDTTALWTSGDPSLDIDGADRPNMDGDLDYAGADIP